MGYVVVENSSWQNQSKPSLVVVLGNGPVYNPANDPPRGRHAQFFVGSEVVVVQKSWLQSNQGTLGFFQDVPTRTQQAKWFDPPQVWDNPYRPSPRSVTDFIQSADIFAGNDTYGWPEYPYPPFWVNEQRGTSNVLQSFPSYQYQNDMFLLRPQPKWFDEPQIFWRGQQPLSRAYDYVPYLNELPRPPAKWFDEQPVYWDWHHKPTRVILDSFAPYSPSSDPTLLRPQAKWFDPQALWWDTTYRVTINAITFLPPPYNPATDITHFKTIQVQLQEPFWVNPMVGTSPVINVPQITPPTPPPPSFIYRWSTRVILDPKKLGEDLDVPVDFISRLAVGETILTATVTASVYSGVDSDPQAMVNGPATINGTVVVQPISGGVLGTTYELLYSVVTSKGQQLELAGYLTVEPDLP